MINDFNSVKFDPIKFKFGTLEPPDKVANMLGPRDSAETKTISLLYCHGAQNFQVWPLHGCCSNQALTLEGLAAGHQCGAAVPPQQGWAW